MKPEEMQKLLDDKFASLQDELKEAQENSKTTTAEIKTLHEAIEKSGDALEEFMKTQKEKTLKGFMVQFSEFLTENKEKLEDIKTKRSGTIEFIPKVVGDIARASGSDVGTPPVVLHTNLGHFNLRNDAALLSLATITSTNAPALGYTELTPKEGGYAFVAEAAAKPQTDFKWENRFVTPFKAAAYEVLSEESVTDVARLESVAREYLSKTHDLYKVNQMFFGDGAGNNPTGATVAARTFVSTDMVDVFAVGESNFMDVVNAIITDIYRTQAYADEAHYMPNIVLINPIDFFVKLVGAKDTRGLPLYPQAGLFNEVRIGGVLIRPWIKVPVDKIFVADMTKQNIVNYVPFSIRIGWIDDQFIKNQFTMVGESRYYQYIKNLDLAAFVYDDITTVQAAITGV